uniref:MADF domain-containing protein n=1 Tax=Glossina brevipalpis TaxID=37001 RepID=A0A1A9X5T2_9MUSC
MEMFEETLIYEVRRNKCIYDRRSLEYRNKIKRKKAWDDIADRIGVPVEQCQGRWKTLRDRFVKEVTRTNPNNSTWKFFLSMQFLTDFVSPRRLNENHGEVSVKRDADAFFKDELPFEESNIYEDQCTTESLPETVANSPLLLPEDDEPSTSKPLKRPRDEPWDQFNSLLGTLTALVEKKFKCDIEDDGFHKFLASVLKGVEDSKRDKIKIDIIVFASKKVQEVLEQDSVQSSY